LQCFLEGTGEGALVRPHPQNGQEYQSASRPTGIAVTSKFGEHLLIDHPIQRLAQLIGLPGHTPITIPTFSFALRTISLWEHQPDSFQAEAFQFVPMGSLALFVLSLLCKPQFHRRIILNGVARWGFFETFRESITQAFSRG
jgi:hypothetical protein